MSPRLPFAYALSLALHGALFLPALLESAKPAPASPALQARLRLPPAQESPAEPLLKNTLDEEKTEPLKQSPVQPTQSTKTTVKAPSKKEIQAAQRKLSEHLFYPQEAVARGIEGEVRLILKLSPTGSVAEVSIAVSSGHAILDNAAIRAAYAMGRLTTGNNSGEMILPVVFRLQ